MAKCLRATSGVVPEFVNPKWVDSSKTAMKAPTRLECMMQDFPRLCTAGEKATSVKKSSPPQQHNACGLSFPTLPFSVVNHR
eukprot:1504963-Amphidinium_carterae.1